MVAFKYAIQRRAWQERMCPVFVWLGSTNGSPQHEHSEPERVVIQIELYVRLAGGVAAAQPPATPSEVDEQALQNSGDTEISSYTPFASPAYQD